MQVLLQRVMLAPHLRRGDQPSGEPMKKLCWLLCVLAPAATASAAPDEKDPPALEARGSFEDKAGGALLDLAVVCQQERPGTLERDGKTAKLDARANDIRVLRIAGLRKLDLDARMSVQLNARALDKRMLRKRKARRVFSERTEHNARIGLQGAVEAVNKDQCVPGTVCNSVDPDKGADKRCATVRERVQVPIRKATHRMLRDAARMRIGSSLRDRKMPSDDARHIRIGIRKLARDLAARENLRKIASNLDAVRERVGDAREVGPFAIAAVGSSDFYARLRSRDEQQWFRDVFAKTGPPEVEPLAVSLRGHHGKRTDYGVCSVTVLEVRSLGKRHGR